MSEQTFSAHALSQRITLNMKLPSPSWWDLLD